MKKMRFFAIFLAIVLVLGSAPAYAAKAPANPFFMAEYAPDRMPVFDLYFHRGGICTDLNLDVLAPAINALPPLKEVQTLSTSPASATFIRVDSDYTKHIYELRPGELKYEGKAYALTEKQYGALVKAINESNLNAHSPYWLIWMNPRRVTEMVYTDATAALKFTEIKEDILAGAADSLRCLGVKKNYETYKSEDSPISLDGRASAMIRFDSGVVYTIYMDKEYLYLESSDQATGIKYKNSSPEWSLAGFMADMEQASKGWFNPETGKPVIYLYPEKAMDINVKLDFKGELCTTIPAYNGGWSVAAEPDGTLTDKADGKRYPYLFWDGNPDFKNWDFSSGFCVKAGETGAFLREKLPALGLLPHEYEEFIDYWQPILEKNKYNLITFSTGQYEAVAPLTISPAPDTVIRVHMVYKGTEGPVGIPAQVLEAPPARKGFTVVEWGGTLKIL